ncbi:hypothetical protein [Lactobacillus sp. ESL0677]|uniref:hypothetical protein n=1 Tax=Lactobacillus sp. ESL0677 TaxID=2983208 RepID=UPI0023F92EA6|nr:hypothetical protein [Lactobacillus sp. ESL0677]WEV37487.1 hypothetical protein OZX76_02750 [Lactobacillus sp. ESL0677]
MFENKLTGRQAFELWGLVQILIGILGYFTEDVEKRTQFLGIFLVIGVISIIASFSQKITTIKTVSKINTTGAQKCGQIIGMAAIGIALLSMILEQKISVYLLPLDMGLTFLILPPRVDDKRPSM